jgi:hypothetical protein
MEFKLGGIDYNNCGRSLKINKIKNGIHKEEKFNKIKMYQM